MNKNNIILNVKNDNLIITNNCCLNLSMNINNLDDVIIERGNFFSLHELLIILRYKNHFKIEFITSNNYYNLLEIYKSMKLQILKNKFKE